MLNGESNGATGRYPDDFYNLLFIPPRSRRTQHMPETKTTKSSLSFRTRNLFCFALVVPSNLKTPDFDCKSPDPLANSKIPRCNDFDWVPSKGL
ncbi:hypothetical protein ABKN59_008254 [Abortiporus biennis]